MAGPEVEIPGRGGVQTVVVADTELLPRLDVGVRHDAHDVAEPRVPELSEVGVVVEGVADFVCESGPVVLQSLLARQDVEVSLGPAADPVVRPVRLLEILPGQSALSHAVEESAELTPRDVRLGEESLARPGPAQGLRDEDVATLEGVPEERSAGDGEGAGWLVVVDLTNTQTAGHLQLGNVSGQTELSHVSQAASHQPAVAELALYGRHQVGVYEELLRPVVNTLPLLLPLTIEHLPHQVSSSPGRRPAGSRLLPGVKPPDGLEVSASCRVLQEGSLPHTPAVLNPPHQVPSVQLLPHHSTLPGEILSRVELQFCFITTVSSVSAVSC